VGQACTFLADMTLTGTTPTFDLTISGATNAGARYGADLDSTTDKFIMTGVAATMTQFTGSTPICAISIGPGIPSDTTGHATANSSMQFPSTSLPKWFIYTYITTSTGTNEVQTIDLGDIGAADTFKLTFNTHETGLITYADPMNAAIQTALAGLSDFADDETDVTVTRTSATVYVATFVGTKAQTDVGAITITSTTGFTPTGVTETTKGVVPTEDYNGTISAIWHDK